MTEVVEQLDPLEIYNHQLKCISSKHPDHYQCGHEAVFAVVGWDTVCSLEHSLPVCPRHVMDYFQSMLKTKWCGCGRHGSHECVQVRVRRLA